MTLSKLIIIIIILININYIYWTYVDYWSLILKSTLKKDFTKWILCDKYVAKEYAKLNGFKVPKTFQLTKYPNNIKFLNTCVIKPTDLCDSEGVYLIKNNINLKTNKKVNKDKIKKKFSKIRSKIGNEHYMHDKMYNGLVPFTGYIVEELLLDDNGNIPEDYKCYVFGGKLHYIAVTFDRITINNKQQFKSVWFDSEWNPIYFSMIQKGYKYKKLKKPKNFEKLKNLVENMSKILKRHCRIDLYIINNDIYLGEYTFFCGAFLHTIYCNLQLGLTWLKNPDDIEHTDKRINSLIPEFYNNPNDY